jgi:LPXTG-motif cell wall-anchored protein
MNTTTIQIIAGIGAIIILAIIIYRRRSKSPK